MNEPPTHTTDAKRKPALPSWLGWGTALLLVVAAWGAAIALRGGGQAEPLEGWVEGFDAGQAQAVEADRPMMVLFTASWCSPCQKLKHDVLTQPEIQAALDGRFVPVKVDLSDQSPSNPNMPTAEHYGVRGIPTLIAMTPDGQPIDTFAGERTVAGFEQWLDRVAP